MGLFSRARVRRTGPGHYAIALVDEERQLLGNLAAQLAEVLTDSTDDPSLRRLFPTAYHDDAERDREYQQLVRDELLTRRLAALATVETTRAATAVDQSELTAWMSALNDLRLVLGTRLDLSEESRVPDPDDPDASAFYVYGYLSELLGEVVDALADGLGDGNPEPSGQV